MKPQPHLRHRGQSRGAARGPQDYRVTVEALEAAWVAGTRAVVLANPANPTGAAYDADQWSSIAGWATRRDVWSSPTTSTANSLRDRCIVISVSKTHSMTGWRVGWLTEPLRRDRAHRALSDPVVSASASRWTTTPPTRRWRG